MRTTSGAIATVFRRVQTASPRSQISPHRFLTSITSLFRSSARQDVAFEIGRFYYGIREYENALGFYRDSSENVGQHHVTFHNMGLCYYSMGAIATEALNSPSTVFSLGSLNLLLYYCNVLSCCTIFPILEKKNRPLPKVHIPALDHSA